MEIEALDDGSGKYICHVTDAEAAKMIYRCLSPSNPNLEESGIARDPYAREYKAHFRNARGEEVCLSVGVGNLKGYFGAYWLAFEKGGLRFMRTGKERKK